MTGGGAGAANRYAFLDHPGPIPFAHQGGIAYPPNASIPNTIAAFRHAVDLGYRYLETDVHLTADRVPVIMHDHTLDRTTTGTGPVSARTLADLAEIRVGGIEPIPTLEQVLEEFGDRRFNIDVKVPEVVAPAVEVIERMGAKDRVCVSAFSRQRLRSARRLLGPGVATGLWPSGVALRRLPLPAFLNRLMHADVACIQVPVGLGALTIITPGFLARAHAAGKRVHVWTIDRPDEMHRLLDLGVDGIMTDRPDLLRSVLVDRGAWID